MLVGVPISVGWSKICFSYKQQCPWLSVRHTLLRTVSGFHLLRIQKWRIWKKKRPSRDNLNDPHHLLQSHWSGSFYTASGTWHFRHETCPLCFHSSSSAKSLNMVIPQPTRNICSAVRAASHFSMHVVYLAILSHLSILSLCTSQRRQLNDFTSFLWNPSAGWEMTDLMSSRRLTL